MKTQQARVALELVGGPRDGEVIEIDADAQVPPEIACSIPERMGDDARWHVYEIFYVTSDIVRYRHARSIRRSWLPPPESTMVHGMPRPSWTNLIAVAILVVYAIVAIGVWLS